MLAALIVSGCAWRGGFDEARRGDEDGGPAGHDGLGDACAGTDCSEHGQCTVTMGEARCACAPGYADVDLQRVIDESFVLAVQASLVPGAITADLVVQLNQPGVAYYVLSDAPGAPSSAAVHAGAVVGAVASGALPIPVAGQDVSVTLLGLAAES